mmetsp:Transcript_53565/g.148152  ORF Transcript_53565/g.148152 Transcript_53565/m.148152 type:complete len:118 (-) Transcript_53565:826-1179(-)
MSDAATPNTEEPAATPGESSDAGEVPAVAASTDSGVVAVQKRRGSLLRQTSNFTDEAMARKVRQGRLLTFADEATTEKPAGDLCRTQYSENLHYSYLNGGQAGFIEIKSTSSCCTVS